MANGVMICVVFSLRPEAVERFASDLYAMLEDYTEYTAWRAARGEGYDLVIPMSTAPPQREIWLMGSTT